MSTKSVAFGLYFTTIYYAFKEKSVEIGLILATKLYVVCIPAFYAKNVAFGVSFNPKTTFIYPSFYLSGVFATKNMHHFLRFYF